jgi:DNA-binding NarL/FixJ family response regulator
MDNNVKVLMVEDDPDFVFLIQKMISRDVAITFLGHVNNAADGIDTAKKQNPDVVLMDINLSGRELEGIQAAKEIRLATDAKVLLLTSFEQPEIVIGACKKAFASGYVFKSQCGALNNTILKTAESVTPQALLIKELVLQELSEAERGVVSMLANGEASIQSAFKTVANQKTSIFRKLGLKNTTELLHIMRNW